MAHTMCVIGQYNLSHWWKLLANVAWLLSCIFCVVYATKFRRQRRNMSGPNELALVWLLWIFSLSGDLQILKNVWGLTLFLIQKYSFGSVFYCSIFYHWSTDIIIMASINLREKDRFQQFYSAVGLFSLKFTFLGDTANLHILVQKCWLIIKIFNNITALIIHLIHVSCVQS